MDGFTRGMETAMAWAALAIFGGGVVVALMVVYLCHHLTIAIHWHW
jgi:hypothetical protein